MEELLWYLKEDLGDVGDITSDALFSDERASAEIVTEENCVLAGLEEAVQLLQDRNCIVNPKVCDGDLLIENTVILKVTGDARTILMLERLILNIMGRMSGIASETHELVSICKKINDKVTVAATRKTTPGFRKFEKKAVVIGGGESHRSGLYDALMIKDNHLSIVGSIEKAISCLRKTHPHLPIEIEVDTYDDAIAAAQLYAEVIMLDNFPAEKAHQIVTEIRRIHPKVLIECSGGITKENIAEYAVFADRISLGCLTHSVCSKDFSMRFY